MRIPAIISEMGDWRYYVSSMTFNQIKEYVSKINNELHKSENLSELLQRAITSNYKKISKYLLEHDDRFFNAIVLAVYEGDPQFREIDFDYNGERFGTMGLLEFTGVEKIFPVDGQHRVEGIKKALEENSDLGSDSIPVIFIGHRNNAAGMERTRRLFSTLNRYSKPVKKSEIIALDEDDIIAIVTRYVVENHKLFKNERISLSNTLKENNTVAFTTIETLYDCNQMLLKNYFNEIDYKGSMDSYLRIRPSEEEIRGFTNHCTEFWNDFCDSFADVSNFLENNEIGAQPYRNAEGGNLLFRPVGLAPLINAVTIIKNRNQLDYIQILQEIEQINMSLTEKPWKYVLWNIQESKVLSRNTNLAILLFLFLYQKNSNEIILTDTEKRKLREKYANKTTLRIDEVDEALLDI